MLRKSLKNFITRINVYPKLKFFTPVEPPGSNSISPPARIKTAYKSNVVASQSPIDELRIKRPSAFLRFFAPTINKITLQIAPHFPEHIQKKIYYYFYLEDAAISIAADMQQLEDEYKNAKKSSQKDKIVLKKIALLPDSIREHAYQRMDLFFHLLIAVWNKKVLITKKGGADFQHGKGHGIYGTAACHSNPFTNLEFKSLNQWGYYQHILNGTPTFEGTHFNDSLNITVELPEVVNNFDVNLEASIVSPGLDILNRCASGKINPVTGLREMLKITSDFYDKFENEHIKHRSDIKLPKSMAEVWHLEKQGTFRICQKNTLEPSNEYISMILQTSKLNAMIGKMIPCELYSHYHRMQEEVYTSKSSLKTRATL